MGAVDVCKVGDGFVDAAVAQIVDRAQAAQAYWGDFYMSLCGGSTPRAIYERLAELEEGAIDWKRVKLTFGDERCVPPDHPDSNYRMVREAMLDRLPIPDENVLRIEAEAGAEVAAERCEAKLREWAGRREIFVHDLVLRGMGDDGHTASLFPGTEALHETDRWVVANYVPKFDAQRITFTYPLINAARAAIFLVTGKEKKGAVVDRILAGGADDPAAAIDPDQHLIWLIGWE